MKTNILDTAYQKPTSHETLEAVAQHQLKHWPDADAALALERLIAFDSRAEAQRFRQAKKQTLTLAGRGCLDAGLVSEELLLTRRLTASVVLAAAMVEGALAL